MKKKGKNKQREKSQTNKGMKLFCCAFKSGFIQLICKAYLIFKSNLELTLSIILKERELYKSKHTVVEFKCLKLRHFFICSSILVLKSQHVLLVQLHK